MKRIAECQHCHNKFETESSKAKYCSWLCKKIEITKKQFPNGSSYVECKICGLRGRQLIQHIQKVHKMTIAEYCEKFGLKIEDLQTNDLHEQMSKSIKKACAEGRAGFIKGGYNPSNSEACKTGRNSAWSKNFHGYDGLSDNEKIKRIAALAAAAQQTRDNNHNNATKLDYYTSRGYSESEAKKLLKEHQRTFTLEKCIKKYGEDEGKRIYAERQERWQNTLKSKPIEEIERINKAKATQSRNVISYSQISQKLFNAIYDIIKNEYKKIYYATHKVKKSNWYNNYEYEVILENGINRYFLDFYVKDNNKVIEFDGDYWHSEKRGNQERDRIREENLKKLGFVNIYHVKERDYKNDPDKIVEECIKFIRGK